MLKFTVQGTTELDFFLTKLDDALDTVAILDEGAAVLFNMLRTRFIHERTPDGSLWLPSQAALRRRALGSGGGTLFNTGKLFYSLEIAAEGEDARSIGTDALAETGFDYPAAHNFGLGQFPERQFMGFGEWDIVAMTDVITKRIRDAVL